MYMLPHLYVKMKATVVLTSLLRDSFCMTMYLALLPEIDMFSSWLMLLSATFLCVSSSILARTSACCWAMTWADCCCCSCCCCSCCCCTSCCCCNCCCWSCCCWSCNCWTAAGWTGRPVVVTTGVAATGVTTAAGGPTNEKSKIWFLHSKQPSTQNKHKTRSSEHDGKRLVDVLNNNQGPYQPIVL